MCVCVNVCKRIVKLGIHQAHAATSKQPKVLVHLGHRTILQPCVENGQCHGILRGSQWAHVNGPPHPRWRRSEWPWPARERRNTVHSRRKKARSPCPGLWWCWIMTSSPGLMRCRVPSPPWLHVAYLVDASIVIPGDSSMCQCAHTHTHTHTHALTHAPHAHTLTVACYTLRKHRDTATNSLRTRSVETRRRWPPPSRRCSLGRSSTREWQEAGWPTDSIPARPTATLFV